MRNADRGTRNLIYYCIIVVASLRLKDFNDLMT